MGVNLNYPHGEPDELLVAERGGDWEAVPLRGSWFLEAFEGPMSNLQRVVAGEDERAGVAGGRRVPHDGGRGGVLRVERARRHAGGGRVTVRPSSIAIAGCACVLAACGGSTTTADGNHPSGDGNERPNMDRYGSADVNADVTPTPDRPSRRLPSIRSSQSASRSTRATKTDRVTGIVGSRVIVAGAGASVLETSERLQVSDDPDLANEDGWDCRVHVEYEGKPAVDWYVQPGHAGDTPRWTEPRR